MSPRSRWKTRKGYAGLQLNHAEVDSLALLISHIHEHVSQSRRPPIQPCLFNAGWSIAMLKLEPREYEPISRARMPLHLQQHHCKGSYNARCSNTAAQANAALESSLSLSLTLKSYVFLLGQILPFNCNIDSRSYLCSGRLFVGPPRL